MSFYKNDELYINQAVDESLSFSKNLPVGSYIADISAHNSFSDSDSGRVTFKVLGRATIYIIMSAEERLQVTANTIQLQTAIFTKLQAKQSLHLYGKTVILMNMDYITLPHLK